jgi:putative endonuclease
MTLPATGMVSSRMPGSRRFVPSAQWEDRRQRRGLAGERVAMAYLISCGWDVEAHRFRLGRHDLDLIVRRDDLVAFVEVKTRRSLVCGGPLESVSALKQRLVSRVAMLWRLRYGRAGDRYRFDLVAVRDGGRGRWEVDHVADAWRLEWSAC